MDSAAPGSDAASTRELPAALAAVEQLKGDALVLLLDIHPYLSNPVVTRALKELALRTEARGLQLVFTGHDIELPDELAPYASRFALEPMTLERVKTLFNEELQAQRAPRSGADLAGERAMLDSLMRHMVGLPEAAVRQMVRATLGDGRICTADLARVLAGKREVMGAAELLVFEQNLPAMDQVAGMKALKRWLLLRREAFLDGAGVGPAAAARCAAAGRAGRGQEPGGQGHRRQLAGAAVPHGLRRAVRQVPGRERAQAARGAARGRRDAALRAVDGRGRKGPVQRQRRRRQRRRAAHAGHAAHLDGRAALERVPRRHRQRHRAAAARADAQGPLRRDLLRRPAGLRPRARPSSPSTWAGIALPATAAERAALAAASEGFAGAEIEAAVLAARYEAHALGQSAAAAHVQAELARTRPLSVTRAEAIAALRDWARGRTVGAD